MKMRALVRTVFIFLVPLGCLPVACKQAAIVPGPVSGPVSPGGSSGSGGAPSGGATGLADASAININLDVAPILANADTATSVSAPPTPDANCGMWAVLAAADDPEYTRAQHAARAKAARDFQSAWKPRLRRLRNCSRAGHRRTRQPELRRPMPRRA